MKFLRHLYNFGGMLLLLVILPTFSLSETIKLYPIKDACVFQQYPNNPNSTTNYIGYTTEDWDSRIELYMKFDLSSIPSVATIDTAILSLYCSEATSAYENGNIFTYVYYITGGEWDESTITWNNKPAFSWESAHSCDFNGTGWWTFNWHQEGDIIDFVQNWVNGTNPNYGLVLDGEDEGEVYSAGFYSKEYSNTNYHPILEVVYEVLGILEVTVKDLNTFQVIPGALVEYSGPENGSGNTLDTGLIEFSLKPGNYILTGSKAGYVTNTGFPAVIQSGQTTVKTMYLDPDPAFPQNLTATAGNQQVTLTWNQNTESDLHKYNIYRDKSSFATTLIDSIVGTPPDTIYIDSGLINGQTYYYRITAVDSFENESYYSDEASDTPNPVMLTVKTDGTGDFTVIQTAINATTNGDTVLVYPGTYVENINFNGKNIVVGSLTITTGDTSYISQTIIDGNQNNSVVIFSNGETAAAVLSGFTIQNGSAEYGGGIYSNNSSPSITNCTINSNSATGYGGGIYCYRSSTTITNCTIINNSAGYGGGIRSYTFSSPTITNCTLSDNSAAYGGGIDCYTGSSVTVVNSIFWENIATGSGDEIRLDGTSYITITYSDIDPSLITGSGTPMLSENINADPLFINAAGADYSPCIGAGTDSIQIDGTWYFAPTTDIDGNSRPNPPGSRPDMGAYENPLAVQPPLIAASTDTLEFGSVIANEKDTLKLTIYDTSLGTDLTITDIQSSSSAFTVSDADFTIPKNDSVLIDIYFNPVEGGMYSDTLKIFSNAANDNTLNVFLTGIKGSYISGVITENTTWDKAHSPYIVNGHLAVDAGITLTMEAGTQVLFDGSYNFNVFGNLNVNGTETDTVLISTVSTPTPGAWPKLNFASGSSGNINYLKLQGSSDGIYINNVGSFSISNSLIEKNSNYGIYLSYTNANIDNCKVKTSGTGIYAVSCSPQINNCTISDNNGNGLYFTSGTSSPTITNSTISNNNGYGINYNYGYGQIKVRNCQIVANTNWGLYFGGAYSGTEIKNCNITGNSAGIYSNIYTSIENNTISANNGDGIYTASSGVTIYQNRISGNAGDGIKTLANIPISYNDIFNNGSDGVETSSLPTINYNNIYGNAEYNIKVTANPTAIINAENNYWGTTIENEIKAKIWDFYDTGGGVAKVDYIPFYTEKVGLLPVNNFRSVPGSGGTIDLSWDAHSQASQYLLYKNDGSGEVDTINVWHALDSTFTSYSLTFSDGEYNFAIRAKSSDSRLSPFSYTYSVADGTPPTMLAASGITGEKTITVTFSENVELTSAENISNWTLSQGLSIDSILAGNYWTTKTSMPTARSSLACAAVGGKIYTIGGDGGQSSVEEYDPVTGHWTTKTSMPAARHYLACAAVGGKIYAIGGYINGCLSTVEEYDPVTSQWTTKTSMPTARYGLACAAVNGKIYAIGGYGGQSTVEEYDPVTDQWTTKTSMPTARYYLACAAEGGKIYAIGGYNNGCFSTVEEYDPVTGQWTTKTSMPTARWGLACAAEGGKIYAIGGYNEGYLSTVEEYTPSGKEVTLYLANSLPSYETKVTVTCNNIEDIYGNQAGEQSYTFRPDDGNTNPSIVLADLIGEQSGDVIINYIINDIEEDAVTIKPEYSIDNGQSWQKASVTGDTTDITDGDYAGQLV